MLIGVGRLRVVVGIRFVIGSLVRKVVETSVYRMA